MAIQLWSFQERDTKLERFFAKNQHTKRKWTLNVKIWHFLTTPHYTNLQSSIQGISLQSEQSKLALRDRNVEF